jgi:pimeloyl-ACP methyl ester carboxylesterase
MPAKKTIVMVPGAYAGSWLYHKIEPRLLAKGHRVFNLTFTGIGERAHLFSPEIDAMTHARDIISLVRFNELTDVILVAHSYAGIPATAAADELGPGLISRLIYLDALVPDRDMGWRDFHTEAQQKANMDNLQGIGEGKRLVPPTNVPELMALLGLPKEDAEFLVRKSTPMPPLTYTGRVTLKNGGYKRFPDRVYVECNAPPLATIAQSKARVKSEHGWTIVELQSGHNAMLSAADQLTKVLDS